MQLYLAINCERQTPPRFFYLSSRVQRVQIFFCDFSNPIQECKKSYDKEIQRNNLIIVICTSFPIVIEGNERAKRMAKEIVDSLTSGHQCQCTFENYPFLFEEKRKIKRIKNESLVKPILLSITCDFFNNNILCSSSRHDQVVILVTTICHTAFTYIFGKRPVSYDLRCLIHFDNGTRSALQNVQLSSQITI